MRHYFCDQHLAVVRNPEQQKEALRRAMRAHQAVMDHAAQGGRASTSGVPAVPPEQLQDHPVQWALNDHQDHRQPCAVVKDWIKGEVLAGRIRTAEDINRVGLEVMQRCCPIGRDLQHQLGEIMAGLRPA